MTQRRLSFGRQRARNAAIAILVLAPILAVGIFAPAVSSAANVLRNPGFEEDANADGKPDAWTSNSHFTRSDKVVRGGTYAGRWVSTSNNGPASYQQLSVTPGATYTISGWVNAPTTSDAFTFEIRVLWRNASKALGSIVIKKFTNDTAGAWQQVSGSVSAPAGATLARVQMKAGSLRTTLYVDDMALSAGSSAPAPTPTPTPSPTPTPTPTPTPSPTASPTPTATPSAGAGSEVLVGAGDIANCNTATDEATATLLDGIAGTVFTTGDNAYPGGTAANFADCYEPTWGRHSERTRPAPGNHDYQVAGATDYFAYFGASAGPAGQGYYAYNLGAWRVYSLNSQNVTSAQESWLRDDLAANPSACIAAYWHHPRWATANSDGTHGSHSGLEPLWDALADAGADLVLNGHSHHYERLASIRGITEVIVGTGGTDLRGFATPIPESVVRNSATHGVLEVTLSSTGYAGQFIPIAGQSFTDSFSGTC